MEIEEEEARIWDDRAGLNDIRGVVEKSCIWEREMMRDGQLLYEQKNYKADGSAKPASDTTTGARIIKKNITKVEEQYKENRSRLIKRPRTRQAYKASIIALPPLESIAMGIKLLVDVCYGADETVTKFQAACLKLGGMVETELRFRKWVTESRNSAKAWAIENDITKTPLSFAQRVLKEEGICRQTIQKWKKSFPQVEDVAWDKQHRMFVGEFILRTIIKALPELFMIDRIFIRGHHVYHLSFTPEGRSHFENSEARAAESRYIKLPMLSKPVRWTKED